MREDHENAFILAILFSDAVRQVTQDAYDADGRGMSGEQGWNHSHAGPPEFLIFEDLAAVRDDPAHCVTFIAEQTDPSG